MNSRIRKLHALEMSQRRVDVTDNTAPTEESTTEDEIKSIRRKQLEEIFRPILIAMKLTGQFFGETVLDDGSSRRTFYISNISSVLVVLGQWLMVGIGFTSLSHIGFSETGAFFYVLIVTIWFIQCASSTIGCLFVLPLTRRRRTRFAQFLSSFVTKAPQLDGMKTKALVGLTVACSAAGFNSIVLGLFSAHFNGLISVYPPWNRHTGMHLTVRVVEMVSGVLNSFAWTLLPLIFCITCMLLEKMFDNLQNKVTRESIQSFTIAYLRQEHLKRCEIVELANSVFSPLLFVITSLGIPLMCINFFQLVKNSSTTGTLVLLSYVYWCFSISTLFIIIFYFGNRVNVKAHSFYETLQKSRISVEDTNENAELMLFLAHLRGEPIGLSVGELAVVNKELFLTVFGIIATYFVVLITLPT